MEEIYLDNATAARPSSEAVQAMRPFLHERWGNPSAPHRRGQDLFPAMENAFTAVYQLLGIQPNTHQLYALSSGAEGINQVFTGVYYDVTRETGKNHYITSTNDEAAAILAASRLEQLGCASSMAKVNAQGMVTAESIADCITPRTALVSLSWANGLTGVLQPVEEIATLCRQRGILLHLDATHVLGKIFFDLDEVQPDFITFHGEPLHLPPGIGGLLVRGKRRLAPLVSGRHENVPMIVALGVAAREAMQHRDHLGMEVARLRDHFEQRLLRDIEGAEAIHNTSLRLPTTSAVVFPRVHSEALLFMLNRQSVRASFGGGHFQRLALQLIAAGVPASLAHTSLSFSLSRESVQEEVDCAADRIAESVRRLQKLSEIHA